ncbi:MAG: L-threonylcarbamoyladenylate synthase [Ignavibacterium sp.]|nr:L-threonylcarbamoyladenylate synthase [Ignavibacterium sp.]
MISIEKQNQIKIAADIIKKGGVVAFPTETVYGLGADAFNPNAVEKIFELKKRPIFDPLIVHLYSIDQLEIVCTEVDNRVYDLAEKFWPGPLTIVLKKNNKIPDIVTSGLNTVGVRIPDNDIARELIKLSETAIAAPSANKFGRISPTKAEHVQKYFSEVDFILNGGNTKVGIESTIIFLNEKGFEILRYGAITKEELEKVIPYCEIKIDQKKLLSPGMLKSHYSPRKPFYILNDSILNKIDKSKSGLISFTGQYDDGFKRVITLSKDQDLRECAINLFSAMHSLEDSDVENIIAEPVPEKGIGIAIMDRLKKAAFYYMNDFADNKLNT